MKQSPIFSKTYDFVGWLIPLTVKFPRQQRFVMAAALQREALRFQELLIEAAHQPQPREMLIQADAELDKLRTHIRLALDLHLMSISHLVWEMPRSNDFSRPAHGETTKVVTTVVTTNHAMWGIPHLISPGQYEYAAGMLVEMGKLLGGWIKTAVN